MAYTYRFVDTNENVIYVGYTGQTMAKRISQHFTKGHLPKKCYKSIARIDYIKWDSKSDAQVMEVYYINKYHPKFNKLDTIFSLLSTIINPFLYGNNSITFTSKA